MSSNVIEMKTPNHNSPAHKSCLEFAHDSYSEDEYCKVAWPALERVLDTFLNQRPGQYVPVKYEETYCHIYKCVCKDYRERLYNDLISFVSNHLQKLNYALSAAFEQSKQNISLAYEFILYFNNVLIQYEEACKGIVAVFHYLNINYIKQKLRSDLNEELVNLCTSKLIDYHIQTILITINDLDSLQANQMQTDLLCSFVDLLYKIKPDYAKLNQALFYKYSKIYLKLDNDNKLVNNNYILLPQQHQPPPPTITTLQQLQLSTAAETVTISISESSSNQQQQQQRKRHADDHASEPRAKLFC